MKLTFIGYGKMAEAMIKGLYKTYEIEVVGRNDVKLENMQKTYNVKVALLDDFNMDNKNIVLAVKPYNLEEVSNKLKGKANLILSVLAGCKIKNLKENLESYNFIRIMPNIASAYSHSMTTLTGDKTYQEKAINICNSFGKSLWLESEKELDIATAVAGSGPAYLAMVAEALADGAVQCGLKREDAQTITAGLFDGMNPLLTNLDPAIIKNSVMSPAGTTAEGYFALEKNGVRKAFIEAVQKAYKKTL